MGGRKMRGRESNGDRKKKSDLKARILTGGVLVVVAGTLAYLGSTALFGLLLVLVLVAQGEFYRAVRGAGHRPATSLGLVAGGTLLIAAYRRGVGAVPVVLFLTLALAFVWHAWGRSKDKALADMAVALRRVASVPPLASLAPAARRPRHRRGGGPS